MWALHSALFSPGEDDLYKHGFSLIGITGYITERSGDDTRWHITYTLGEFCPGVFYFAQFIFYAHWMPGSSISFHSLSMAIESSQEIRQVLQEV